MMLPVLGPGFRAGFGPLLAASLMRMDQQPVPNCLGLRPGLLGDRFSVRSRQVSGRSRPKTSPGSPAREPEALSKGSRRCFCWPRVFLEAWGTQAKKHTHFQENHIFLALVPQASRGGRRK